jgi:hypothetical protein
MSCLVLGTIVLVVGIAVGVFVWRLSARSRSDASR